MESFMERYIDFNCNPVLGNGMYMADAEARCFDGVLYFYGTSDGGARVVSTPDLINFTDHGTVVSPADVTWKEAKGIWAPDCARKNGKYYLYYSLPTGECGVSVGETPFGPFENSRKIEGITGIDPAVLQDDDGQAYIYYGQCNSALAAKLNPDMISIDTESITHTLNVNTFNYHEGISVRKIGKKYYFVYTDTSRHGQMPVCQGYSVSDSPMSGFSYRGVLIDNFGCDPQTWNNHGSIEFFNGKWYIFYHCSTNNTCAKRRLFAEELKLDENGDFEEAEMTSSGIYAPIAAQSNIPASVACLLSGGARKTEDGTLPEKSAVSELSEGGGAIWKYISFDGENTLEISTLSPKNGRAELYIDGKYRGTVFFEKSESFKPFTAKIPPVFGVHTVELKFFGTPHWNNFDMLSGMSFSRFTFEKN